MAALGNNVKMAFLKSLEAIGKSASNMAGNAHQKLNEIGLENRRRELLSEFPVRALDLWQKGAQLPEPLDGMMAELSELDRQLTVLRARRYAKVEAEEPAQEASDETAEALADEADGAKAADEADAAAMKAAEEAWEELPQDEPTDEDETGDNA